MARRPFEDLFAEPLRNGLNRPSAVRGEGVKMVNMGEIFAVDRIDETVDMERVPLDGAEAERFRLEPDDLLFARQSIVASGAGKSRCQGWSAAPGNGMSNPISTIR